MALKDEIKALASIIRSNGKTKQFKKDNPHIKLTNNGWAVEETEEVKAAFEAFVNKYGLQVVDKVGGVDVTNNDLLDAVKKWIKMGLTDEQLGAKVRGKITKASAIAKLQAELDAQKAKVAEVEAKLRNALEDME